MTLSLVQHKMKLSNVAVETNLREDLPAVPVRRRRRSSRWC